MQRPRSRPARGTVGPATLAALIVLLAIPVYLAGRLSNRVPPLLLAGAAAATSGFTFVAYGIDKRRAEVGDSRVPEATLHLAELLGGWPGALIAQRWFRHKTAKPGYQFVFWLIVLLHELVALDAVQGWRNVRLAVRAIGHL